MPTIDDYRNKFPSLKALDDSALIDRVAEVQGVSRDAVMAHMGYKPKARGMLSALNDTVIEGANAVAGGVKSVGDFVAPGNPVSAFIDENIIKAGEAKQSDVVKAEKARYRAEMEGAEGIGDEVGATLGYVARNPVQSLAQAAGSFVLPGAAVKGGGMLASMAGAGVKGATRAGLAGGAVAGAVLSGGDAAGTAYELVKKAGGTDEQATEAARKASVLPAAIGAAGGVVGAERLLAGAKGFGGNAASRALKTAGVEGAQEAVEEGVTQYEGQAAAAPYDPTIDPMKGVAGAATMGAVLGGATGGAVSLLEGGKHQAPKVDPVLSVLAAPSVDDAINAATAAVSAKPAQRAQAPAELPQMDPDDRREVLGLLQVVNRPGVSPNVARFAQSRMDALLAPYRSIPAGEATEMLPVPDARELTDEERAEYVNAVPFSYRWAMQRGLPQPEVTELLPTGDATEVEPIPAADAFEELPAQEAYEVAPVGEASELLPTPDVAEYDQVPAGEASELDAETIQADDLLARDGEPFTSKTGAQAKAYASGGGKVVAIPNHFGSGQPGYVVRPLMPGRPSNTRGTDARDLPRSSNVNQPDVAGTAGQPVADGAGRPDAAVGGELAAGRVASDTTGQQPGTAAAVAPGSAGNAPVGAGNAADAALTEAAPKSIMKPGFDSDAWQKDRDDRIKASREAGNTHLDKVPAYVETMRGKQIGYVHDPKVKGRILTVDNNGNVYVEWLDAYSQEKEGAVPMKYGNKTVMQTSLGPRDLKDYTLAAAPAPTATAPTFTEGQRVQLAGQSYTVTTVNGSAVKLQGADGSTKMVARNSKTFQAIQQEPNEAARPQPEAQRAEAKPPAAAPAGTPAAPAVVPGATTGAVEADEVDDSIDPFTLDKRTLNDRIDRLVSAGEAADSISGFMELRKRYMKATGKPSIPPAGSRFVALYPDAATTNAEALASTEAPAPERTPKAQAVKEALADERQPFEHAGLKVYPTKMRRDKVLVDAWAVQLPENRGTGKVLGDTLHTTIDEAKKSAEYEAKRDNDRKEWERKEEADRADREAKKEANRGKNITERAADFTLNQPNKLPPSAGLGTGTRREAMDKAVEQGRAIRAEPVEDTAAKNRDKKAVEAVSKAGYLLGASNENIPVVKAGLEARARLKADKYEKTEYRVYGGRLAEGPFHTITKIEYDYAVQQQAEQFAAEQGRPAPAPMDAATHKDPGDPAEPVTPAVVREAIKTGVQATDRKPSAMKAELLAKIDAAIADAPDEVLPVWKQPTKDQIRTAMVSMKLTNMDRAEEALRTAHDNRVAEASRRIGHVNFSVEGDGQFKVLNSKPYLEEFRRKVAASPGFKAQRPGPLEGPRDGGENGSGGKVAAFDNMVNEGDLEAASDYADAVGLELDPKKLANATKVLKWRETRPAPAPEAAAQPEAEAPAPAADDRVLTIENGGSTQTLTLPKPAWQATDDELVQAVKDSGAYLGKPGSKTLTVDAHLELFKAVRAGTATPDEFKALYRTVRDNKDAITAELNTSTKDELLKGVSGYIRPGTTKGELVDLIYTGLLRRFALGKDFGPSSYVMGNEKAYAKAKRDGLDALVEGQTAGSLAEYAAEAKAEFDAEIARRTALLASIKEPKTLEDFQRFMRYQGNEGKTFTEARMMLTPEQRAAYDELAAESSRSSRKVKQDTERTTVRAAGQTTAGEIIATKHTRDGHDLWVVKLADRVSKDDYVTLLASAKRLGGNYSSFRGNGAVPGFQFRTPDAAQAFLKLAGGDAAQATEVAQERRNAFEDDRSQSAAERLTEMADRLEERADESLGRDRKANTDRRARFAAAAEAAASADKAMAKTMRNIASAITGGGAKFLDRVRQKVQVELLQTYVANAKSDELRAKYPSYDEQERHRGERPTFETADYAEFPTFTAYRSDLASLGRQLLEVDGTKKMGERIMKVADDVSDAFTAFVKEPGNLFRLSTFSVRAGDEVRTAIFPTREGAERAISRSGLSGKAIVFPEKRGVNRIILSPSEAMARGIWKGDGDKRITLDPDFAGELVEKIGRVARRGAKVSVPWQFERAYDRRKQLSRMGIETPAEFRAALREFIAMREQPAEADKIKAMERAMVGRRNDGLDFFPTPEGVADEMVAAADIQPGMRVLEPSAGMGHIAERIRATEVDPDVVEFSNDRRELLEAKGFNVVARDFMDLTEGGYDRILMNPPFSDGRDIQHVRHAYDLLKPGGRLVAIMGESAFFNQNKRATEFREWLESVGGTDEKLPEGTFNDPSLPVTTGANARMVVIEKPAGETGPRSIIDGPGADAQFSRATPGRTGVPMADAKAVVATIREALPTAPEIVLHDSVRRAPDNLRRLIRQAGADNDVEAVYHDGEIHVFPGNISSIERMQFVVAHHEVRHHGLRSMLGPQMGPAMLRMYASNPNLKAAADAKMAAGLADTRILAVEEALADMPVEDLQKLTGWARIVAAARQWLRQAAAKLRRAGLNTLADAMEPEGWTDNDIAALVQRAEDVSRGGAAPFNSGGTVFQRAYHGTPYRGIERFDTEAIGTGEGAQAYGWGLYFASKREVAEHYRETLSARDAKGYVDAHLNARRLVERFNGDPEWAAEVVKEQRDALAPSEENYTRLDQTLKFIESGDYAKPLPERGQLYEVEVPENNELLLWDRPVRDQPEAIREAIYSASPGKWMTGASGERRFIQPPDANMTGGAAYARISRLLGGDRQASDALRAAGVKGMKYLDGGSRSATGAGWRVRFKNGQYAAQVFPTEQTARDAASSTQYNNVDGVQYLEDGSFNYVIFSGDDVAIQQALFSRADQTQTPDTRPQAVRAVQTMPRSPLTGRPVFDLLDAAGNRIETQHHAKTADEALENYRERPARQAAARAAAPAPTYAMPEKAAKAEGSNWRRVRGQEFTSLDEDDAYLYHVTSSPAAAGVREQGLVPNAGGMFGGFYANYSAGKVFLTERSGVSYWQEKVGQQLEAAMENPPAVTVLRIPKDKIKAKLLPDTVGSGDARAPAFYSNEAVFSRAGTAKTTAQDLLKANGGIFGRAGETKRDRVRAVVDGSRPFWLGALTRDQIADMYGDELPPVREYDNLTRAMENERQSAAQKADELYEEWSKIDAEANDRLARLMLDATVAQVHPDRATLPAKATEEQKQAHSRLRVQFNLLPKDAQAMYGKVRDFHANTLKDLRAALEGRIERLIDNGSERAVALADIRARFDKYMQDGPYFPLHRFGDFLVVAERAKDGERVVAAYENAGEQQAAARALEADGFAVKLTMAKAYSRSMDGSAGKFIGDVLAAIDKMDMREASINGASTSMKAQLLDDLNQLFIKALPDLSYRKHFTHRKGTAGFSADVMRGFASSAFHAAGHIARLNHGDKMTFALEDAYQQIKLAPEGDFTRAGQVLNEMSLRHESALNPNVSPLSALATQVGFVMYLGLSPAAGLINMMQVPMVALPYIGARYGFTKATAAMGRAYKDIMGAKPNAKNGFNAAQSPKLSADERRAISTLQDEGVIDLTQAHDLAAATTRDVGNQARNKASFAIARAMRIVGWTFHVPEVMNRQVTALMAYRLEMAKSGDDGKAMDAAREAIKRSQFDYSSSNRARFMQGDIARVVTQFRQFSQNMTYFLGRAAYQALKGEDPEVRRIARQQLVATFLVTGAMAGSLGLPGLGFFAGLVQALVNAMGDDDDEPWDWKVAYRNALADNFGKEWGEVMARGVPRALMPAWDISNRVSLGDLWWRDSSRDSDSPREAYASDLGNILGPTAGTLLGWYTASDHMARGDYAKAVESVVPKFIRDPLKAWRESQDGVTSYNGEQLLELTGPEVAGRFLGFAPSRASEMYEGRSAVMGVKTALEDRRERLIAKMAKARINGDTEVVAEMQQRIRDWNTENPRMAITGATIVRSVLNRRRNTANTEKGITLPDSKNFLRDRARFAEVD